MKAVVAAFNQEKALVGALSVITNLRMELFQALLSALRWLIVLVNVERSTGGGRGQGRGSGEVKCSSLLMDNMWVADLRRQGETLNHRTIDGSVLLYSRR